MARSRVANTVLKIGDFILKWIVAILGLILLIAAFIHGLGVGTPEYPYSALIYVEVALVFVLVFLIPAYIVSAIVTLSKRNWRNLRVLFINICFGSIFLYGALVSDAPTLIHMT